MFSAPLSAKYINSLAGKLLEPIKRGESAFIRWFPGHGKTILLQTISDNKFLLKKYLGTFFKRFIFIKVEGPIFSFIDVVDYFNYIVFILSETLIKKKLLKSKNNTQASPNSLINTIKKIAELCKLAIENGNEIVFLIDGIDDFPEGQLKEIFNGWEYIIEANRERIHTHINVNKRQIYEKSVTQSGLIQNIIHIPLPNRQESKYFIRYYVKKWKLQFTRETSDYIFKVCGNDPVLLKESLRIYKKSHNKKINLLEEPTLLLKAKIDFAQLSEIEKAIVTEVVKTNYIQNHQRRVAEDLEEANFWNKRHDVPLALQKIISETEGIQELKYDKTNKVLKYGSFNLGKKLSDKEYNILFLLYKNRGEIISRDKIAETLWGEKMPDLYSDWAIDKTISRLRKKLADLQILCQISTKKKLGFCLTI